MAIKIAVATGNWSTAGTWESVVNTPSIHASTNITISTSNAFSATFTAPNLTDACTGVLVYLVTKGSAVTITATLQDNSVDTSATATITLANLTVNSPGVWVYFRFGTPYTFASLAAGRYRFKLVVNTSTLTVGADAAGTAFAYAATSNATGAPGSTDDVYIPGQNGTTTITVTMEGTRTVGSGADTTTSGSNRTVGAAIQIGDRGLLKWDTAADATLTMKGHLIVADGGEWQMGTVASPMPAARTARLRLDEGTTSVNYGLIGLNSAKISLQGAPKSSTSLWKTKYVSGTGVAASPLVVSTPVDWTVGDEILVGAASANATNYNETESRYIITKNSSTSYVVSTSKGGAEAALTFTHTTDAWVLNVERNVWIDTTDAVTPKAFYYNNLATVAGNVDFAWARFETVGSGASSAKFGIGTGTGSTHVMNLNYCVAYRPIFAGFAFTAHSIAGSYVGLIGCYQLSATNVGAISITNNTIRQSFTDCFAMGNNRRGFEIATGINVGLTFTRCVGIGNNGVGSTANAGLVVAATSSTFTHFEAHCNRNNGVLLNAAVDVTFVNPLIGTKGVNQAIDILVQSATYDTVLFTNGSFGSATLISQYALAAPGSLFRFHRLNQTANNHAWYTAYGSARSTGAALADTTVRAAGGLGVRLAPEDATTGFSWQFRILAKANSIVSFLGFFQKNVAFGTDVAKVELYLPGNEPSGGVPDASQTLTNVTGTWQAVAISANYTGTEDLLAIVNVTGLTATAAAYLYADDFYNAGTGNKIAGLDTWYQGQPVDFLVDTTFDPASVWSYDTANLTVAGTTGKVLVDNATAIANVQTRVPAALDANGFMKADVEDWRGATAPAMTGDAYARVGAAGAGLTALGDARIANLDATISSRTKPADTQARVTLVDTVTTLTNAPADSSGVTTLLSRLSALRAGYLDNLSAGAVALEASVQALIGTVGASAAGIAVAVWSAMTRTLTAGTNISLAKGTGVTGFNDLSAAQVNAEVDTALADAALATAATLDAVKAKTDNLPGDPADASDIAASFAAISIPTTAQIADRILLRNLAGGSDGGRTVQDALRFSRNRVRIVPIDDTSGTLTVYAEDDVTPAWSGVVSRAQADALSEVNPS